MSKFKLKEGFVIREVAGQTVAVPTGEVSKDFCGMVKLNKTAKDLWTWLSDGKTVDEMVELMTQKYGVEREQAQKDIEAMLKKMDEAGFLVRE